MAKSLSIFFILSFFLIGAPAEAQSPAPQQSSCVVVNRLNHSSCCPQGSATSNACYQYYTRIPGQIGAPLSTTPLNMVDVGTAQDTGFADDAAKLSACQSIKFKNVLNILIWLKCIIVVGIIPLIFALAFLFFLWGVFRFMMASDTKAKQESQKLIWWGLIGLFVMVSLWGIIKILNTTLGIDSTAVPILQTTYLKNPQ